MEREYKFLSTNKETGELDINTHKVLDYLTGYVPGYRATFSVGCLRQFGRWKKEAIQEGRFDNDFEDLLLDLFVDDLKKNAAWWNQVLNKTTLERHLDIAKEYLESIRQ